MAKEKNIAYKAMNSDMTCNDYQYEVGKSYEIEKGTKLELCENGFHFCFSPIKCLFYYDNIKGDKRFFKIQYDNLIKDENYNKGCTNKITILEEINIIDYIKENEDIVEWTIISSRQKLSEDFIRKYKDKINWFNISICQTLSEDFIIEFKNKVNWKCISRHQILSEDFIKKYKNKIDWREMSANQILTEKLIREFKDVVYWCFISQYQKLSESFIRDFQDKVVWDAIYLHQRLSTKFKQEFKHKLNQYTSSLC